MRRFSSTRSQHYNNEDEDKLEENKERKIGFRAERGFMSGRVRKSRTHSEMICETKY